MQATIQENLKALLEETVRSLYPGRPGIRVLLEVPKNRLHGDLTTNLAMRIARSERKDPLAVARDIAAALEARLKTAFPEGLFKKIEVLPPGFINFFLTESHHRSILRDIAGDDRYGAASPGKKTAFQIEFVSANPTGPLSVAHGRQAAVGDSLASILEFSGHAVSREYYVNDVGNQIRLLGLSLHARYREALGEKAGIPEGGYRGAYLVSLAEALKAKHGARYREASPETLRFFEQAAVDHILGEIRRDLERFRVRFDRFFHESELHKTDKISETLAFLREKNLLYEAEGATWFRSSRFGDEKDRVVKKSDGSYTYLAPDIAYHREKRKGGFERLVNIWGPDHHGYIGRLKAALAALGAEEGAASFLIIQLATLYREGVAVPMSTRMGEFVTLREVLDEVGVDAARFFFLMKKCSSHLDFDLSLAKKQSLENPVYTIQYAHARVSNILAFGKEKGPEGLAEGPVGEDRLTQPEELDLLKTLGEFPAAVQSCVRHLEPYYLALYLQKAAGAFHRFYQKHRVITEDIPLSRARLQLALCVQKVIGRGLSLLGISAPDKM